MSCHHVETWWWCTSPLNLCGFKKQLGITRSRSQTRPSVDVGSVQQDSNGTMLAMGMSRMFDWGNVECRPVLDRAQFLARVSKFSEFRER